MADRSNDAKLTESIANVTNTLNELLSELKEFRRPYVLMDILPGNINPNLLDVVICNVGKIPAYNISFIFDFNSVIDGDNNKVLVTIIIRSIFNCWTNYHFIRHCSLY